MVLFSRMYSFLFNLKQGKVMNITLCTLSPENKKTTKLTMAFGAVEVEE